VVEEAVASGCDAILLVTGRGERVIEDHFDKSFELERRLEKDSKTEMLEEVQRVGDMAHVHYVRQPEPEGLGHAVLCAKKFVGDDPFLVLLGDDITYDGTSPSQQLVEAYEDLGGSVFSLMQVPREEIGKYGAMAGDELEDRPGTYKVRDLVEKPDTQEAPSTLATMGRYIFEPGIFDYIEETPPDEGGEIQLTDAMARMAKAEGLYGVLYEGNRLDVGTVEGFLEANLTMALERSDTREDAGRILHEAVTKLDD
jgi:UTP--glucose-1-phosphate uridylyltransferase